MAAWRYPCSAKTIAHPASVPAWAASNDESKSAEPTVEQLKPRAEEGDKGAQFYLGYMYAIGRGTAQNYTEAAKWYRKAADQGHPGAQANLAVLYSAGRGVEKNEAEAVKLWTLAADQGELGAISNLGIAYSAGRGVPKNEAEAVKWYTKAAEKGSPGAQFNSAFREIGACCFSRMLSDSVIAPDPLAQPVNQADRKE